MTLNAAVVVKPLNCEKSQRFSGDMRLTFFFVCAFIVAIYARPEDIFPVVEQLHLTFALGLAAAITFLLSVYAKNVSISRSHQMNLILLLSVWFVLCVPFAYWRGGSFAVLTQTWLKTALIVFLLEQTVTTLSRVRAVLWTILLSVLAVTAYSLSAPHDQAWRFCPTCGVGDRMSGVNKGFLYWNVLGIALGILIPYIAALFIAKRSAFRSLLLAAAIGCGSWMLVLTASRSGTMTVVLSILLTLVIVTRGTPRGKLIGALALSALGVALLLAPGVFWNRMATLSGDQSNDEQMSAVASTDQRFTVLKRSIDYTLQRPIFGLGLGNFEVATGGDYGDADSWVASHNTFTEISSEAGIPALLLFVTLIASVIESMRRVSRATKDSTSAVPQNVELNLFARATLASTLTLIFGLFFANIGYEYFLYVCPIAIGIAVQNIAIRRNVDIGPTKSPAASFRFVSLRASKVCGDGSVRAVQIFQKTL